MSLNGLTARSAFRMSTRHFIHECFLEKWSGKQNDKDVWTSLGLFKCRHIPTGGVAFSGTGNAQDFDSTVLLMLPGGQEGGAQPAFERTGRYRLRVVEYKGNREATDPDGEPELKRQYWLEMTRADHLQDAGGNDLMASLECRNSKPWAALPSS